MPNLGRAVLRGITDDSEHVCIAREGPQHVVMCKVLVATACRPQGCGHEHPHNSLNTADRAHLCGEQHGDVWGNHVAPPHQRRQRKPVAVRGEGDDGVADTKERGQPLPEIRPQLVPDDTGWLPVEPWPAEDPRFIVLAVLLHLNGLRRRPSKCLGARRARRQLDAQGEADEVVDAERRAVAGVDEVVDIERRSVDGEARGRAGALVE
mmetsp:Transcript_92016/g.263624  ORF Transcript_92016/g.263624 Transcript_92016/m.263624 type:complete len:208 (+) Transcript_92016:547-1170(+)